MRFIRKGGRVIPINDERAKVRKQANEGMRGVLGGVGIALAGSSALTVRDTGKRLSAQHGARALQLARGAHQAKHLGDMKSYGALRDAARGAAVQSLKHGKIASVAQKVGRAGLLLGMGTYLAGTGMLVAAGARATALRAKTRKKAK